MSTATQRHARGIARLSSSIEHDQSAYGARQAALGNPPQPRPDSPHYERQLAMVQGPVDAEHARTVVSPTSRHDLDYLTPGELAAALKVSKRTLSRAERDGRLEGWVSEGVGTLKRYRRRGPADERRAS